MTLRTEDCTIALVSETGRRLIEGDDRAALLTFTRGTLACPRLRDCLYGDYCTIFAASLLSQMGRSPDDDDD